MNHSLCAEETEGAKHRLYLQNMYVYVCVHD